MELTRAGPRSPVMSKPLQHQIIARALEIVSDEEHWTRAGVARTADGRQCACFDPRAARFCAIGALNRAARELLGVAGLSPLTPQKRLCWPRTADTMTACPASTTTAGTKSSSRCSRSRSLNSRRPRCAARLQCWKAKSDLNLSLRGVGRVQGRRLSHAEDRRLFTAAALVLA